MGLGAFTPHHVDLIYTAALASFWRKNALRKFLRGCGVAESFLATWAPEESKRDRASELCEKLLRAFQVFWTQERLATLSRIAVHGRQFEAWWKWELATFLSELAENTGTAVFVESHARADIVLANEKFIRGASQVDDQGFVCIPIELKTTGTWWGSTMAGIKKALSESGKKRLGEDLRALAGRARRSAPFAVVALLATDSTGDSDLLERYGTMA